MSLRTIVLSASAIVLVACVAAPAPAPPKAECRPYPPAPGSVCSEDTELVPTGAGLVCVCSEMMRRIRAVAPEPGQELM
jgi:hypothetical protein